MEYAVFHVSPPWWQQRVTKLLMYVALCSLIAAVVLFGGGSHPLHIQTSSSKTRIALDSSAGVSRMRSILPNVLTPDQHALYDRIVAGAKDSSGKPLKTRVNSDGSLTGPFNGMLLNPKLGQDSMNFLEDLRFGNLTIRHRVVETVILRVAFDTKCGYEFCAHRPMAGNAGVSDATIEALRQGQEPTDMHSDQVVALALAVELTHGVGRNAVSDATYRAAVRELGEQGVFEVVTVTGYYIALAQTINTFQMPCANGEPDPYVDL